MAQIQWQPLFETGIAHIDEQHRELLRILNALESAIASGYGDEAVVLTLGDMANYAAIHFRAEELFMRKIEYPDLKQHVELHRKIVSQVKAYWNRTDRPAGVKAQEILRMLTDWLIDHIVVEDKKYARWAEVHRTVHA